MGNLGVGLLGYKTLCASWIRQQRVKNSAYNRRFSPFSSHFARIFCMGAIAEP